MSKSINYKKIEKDYIRYHKDKELQVLYYKRLTDINEDQDLYFIRYSKWVDEEKLTLSIDKYDVTFNLIEDSIMLSFEAFNKLKEIDLSTIEVLYGDK